MMNKKTTALCAGIVLLTACQTTPPKTVLKGEISGIDHDTLVINFCAVDDMRSEHMQQDTVILQQGKFSYTLPQDSIPTEVYLYSKKTGKRGHTASLLILPGQTISLTGNLKDYTTSGSPFHQEWEEVKALCQPIRSQMDSIGHTLTQMQDNGAPHEEIAQIYEEQFRPLMKENNAILEKYIREHLNSHVSLYLLRSISLDKVKEILPLLDESVKNGPLKPLYIKAKENIERQEAREKAKENIAEGKPAPDFTLNDLNGQPLTLSSLQGKYVVLDFWGSWCGWCIKGMPEMKKYYKKYQHKMEILGIDCRDTEEKWKAAVQKHELPWLHVRSENPDVSQLYAIEGYPTKIIINPKGLIDKVVIGEDPAFYEYLDKLFN